ncbi:Maf1-domain-containing protein, partial [Violaceomyces palustris]
MKYLEYPELELLSRALTFESAECKVFTRMEAYSCKTVNKEKRLYKNLEESYLRSASTSPPDYLEEILASPFGRLDQASARKTLFLLIATLNCAFPDHDFSEVNPADFRREPSPAMVLNSLSTTLLSLKTGGSAPRSYSSIPGSFGEAAIAGTNSFSGGFSFGPTATQQLNLPSYINHPALSSILDDIMNVSDCEVYTFHPDMDSDPHASAEPDEEGEMAEEDPYNDGHGYWDGDSDTEMKTPRGHGVDEDDDGMMDTPMFDEDVYGGGFGDSTSRINQSVGPQTPGKPARSLPPSKSYSSHKSRSQASTSYESGTSFSAYTEDSSFEEDEDLDGSGAGLLWSTFAFFYNRKMKRILFVSVWSRKNTRYGSWSMAPRSPPIFSTSAASPPPPLASFPTMAPIVPARSVQASNKVSGAKRIFEPSSSPTKRHGLARVESSGSIGGEGAGSGRRSRAASGSPAPSSLSPFPHASPRAASGKTGSVAAGTNRSSLVGIGRGKGGSARLGFASLDGAILSASAPA